MAPPSKKPSKKFSKPLVKNPKQFKRKGKNNEAGNASFSGKSVPLQLEDEVPDFPRGMAITLCVETHRASYNLIQNIYMKKVLVIRLVIIVIRSQFEHLPYLSSICSCICLAAVCAQIRSNSS